MLLLGLESSCDELAAAVVSFDASAGDASDAGDALDARDAHDANDTNAANALSALEVRAHEVHGQHEIHRAYGGVVPELASRDHVRNISQVVEAALDAAGVRAEDLSAVAATAGPGLLGSLLVGLSFGKALALRIGAPFVAVHHLDGHLAAAELAAPALRRPYLGLVVSGGHTALYEVGALPARGSAASLAESCASALPARGARECDEDLAESAREARDASPASAVAARTLGETRDDAVGEAFDKVARLLGLGYPGGPAISKLAQRGDARAFDLPRPMLRAPGLDFSYSGLKTAVALAVEARAPLSEQERADLAASFEAAATDVLVARAERALRETGLSQLAVVGGVAANARLRSSMYAMGEAAGAEVFFPPLELCTDNAVMIAAAGATALQSGHTNSLDTPAFSRVREPERPRQR